MVIANPTGSKDDRHNAPPPSDDMSMIVHQLTNASYLINSTYKLSAARCAFFLSILKTEMTLPLTVHSLISLNPAFFPKYSNWEKSKMFLCSPPQLRIL